MAGFLSRLFTPKVTPPSPCKTDSEQCCQSIGDSQPRNVYQEATLLYGHTAPVRHIVKINESHFATASDDCSIILWNAEKGCITHKFKVSHTVPITSMLASYGGMIDSDNDVKDCTLVTSSLNELVIWELTGDDSHIQEVFPRFIIGHHEFIKSLCFLQHGILCSGGRHLCLWDIFSGKLLSRCDRENDESDIHSVLAIQGRNFGIVAASNCSKPGFFEVKKSTMTQMSQYHLQFNDYLLSFHNGPITCLASVSVTLFATGAQDGSLILWSANSLNAIKKFECCSGQLVDVNGASAVNHVMVLCERFLFAAVDCGFNVFDIFSSDASLASQTELNSSHKPVISEVKAHYGKINHMEFLFESSLLLTASADGTVRMWGTHMPFPHLKTTRDDSMTKHSVEVFLGMQTGNHHARGRKRSTSGTCTKPTLLGELLLHSSSVEAILHLGGNHGIATCGYDNIVILWKNAEEQMEKKNKRIKDFLQGEFYYDAHQ